MARIVIAGVATVDIVFFTDEPTDRPIKYRASRSTIKGGGCAFNAALAAAKLGGEVHLSCALGKDHFADMLRGELGAAGIDTELLVICEGVGTSRSAVLVDGAGERTIVNHRDPELATRTVPLSEKFDYDAALADTRWEKGAAAVLGAARAAGRPAVLDAEAPVLAAAEALRTATHVAFSEQGLADLCGRPIEGEAEAREALAKAAAELRSFVCVTRGAEPVLCLAPGQEISAVEAIPVKAVDTLGAGDVWHGAFTLFLGEGMDERDAVRHSNAVAAMRCAAPAGSDGLPDRAALEKFLGEKS